MRVLVLHSGVDWLARALVAAGEEVVEVVPTAMLQDCRDRRPNGRFLGIDRWSDTTALDVLAQEVRGIEAVGTATEEAVYAAGYLRTALGLPGMSARDARACTAKNVSKKRLRRAGIAVTDHLVIKRGEQVAAAAEVLGWPVVVKPIHGAASAHTYLVTSRRHLEELLHVTRVFDMESPDPTGRLTAAGFQRSLHQAEEGFMVEAFVHGPEYFLDLYRVGGQTVLACPGAYDAPLLQTLGQHSLSTLLPADNATGRELVGLGEEVADALNIRTGAMHLEAFWTRQGWVVGEAGARPGGGGIWQMCVTQHGADIPAAMAALTTGRRPDLAPAPRFPVLTTLHLIPPPGTVTAVAPAKTLLSQPSVVQATLNLTVGQPVPGHFGTMNSAGSIVFASARLDTVETDAARLLEVLDLRVARSPRYTQLAGATR